MSEPAAKRAKTAKRAQTAKRAKTEVPPATATSEEVSDLLLDFGGDTMPAVSQLLRLASPVFNRMLVSNMKEAQKKHHQGGSGQQDGVQDLLRLA